MSVVTIAAKRALGEAYRLGCSGRPRRIILLYHSFGSGAYATTEVAFRQQIEWLATSAELVSVSELMSAPDSSAIRVAMTFDDGYESLHRVALPILSTVGWSGTVFLNTGWIGESERRPSDAGLGHNPNDAFLLWKEVEDLVRAGWIAGSHGVDHLDFSKETKSVAEGQLHLSMEEIRRRIGTRPEQFSYTWGRHTALLERLVAKSGYKYAFTNEHRPVSPNDDLMTVPRIDISNEYSLEDFKAVVRGDWDYLGWLHRVKHHFHQRHLQLRKCRLI